MCDTFHGAASLLPHLLLLIGFMTASMQRSDVVLADLEDFLSSQASSANNNSNIKIVLAVASDTSSLLPCCRQSLGVFRSTVHCMTRTTLTTSTSCFLLQGSKTLRSQSYGPLLTGRMTTAALTGRTYTSPVSVNTDQVSPATSRHVMYSRY